MAAMPTAYPPPPPSAAQLYAKALYDPRPTASLKSQHRLAYALGYPADWRVERRIKTIVVLKEAGGEDIKEEEVAVKEEEVNNDVKKELEEKTDDDAEMEEEEDVKDVKDNVEAEDNADEKENEKVKTRASSLPAGPLSVSRTKSIILDRIHASSKNGRKFTWFSHAHALAAAAYLANETPADTKHLPASYPSQLLPPEPRFNKGDTVQVLYNEDDLEDDDDGKKKKKRKKQDKDTKSRKSGAAKDPPRWYSAVITKRRRVGDEYLYGVFYPEDESTQSDVEDELLEPAEDPVAMALNLGFPEGWTASKLPQNKYRLTTPDGYIYNSMAAARKYVKSLERKAKQQASATKKKRKPGRPKKKAEPIVEEEDEEPSSESVPPEAALTEEEQFMLIQQRQLEEEEEQEDDPPWRTTGHPFLGRRIQWTQEHQISARRTIHVEQEGEIVGYISKTDLDSQGQPGFTNSKGEPADLFHVEFSTQELNHPYAQHLLASQDLESYEVETNLLPEDESDEEGDSAENGDDEKKSTSKKSKATKDDEEEKGNEDEEKEDDGGEKKPSSKKRKSSKRDESDDSNMKTEDEKGM